MHDIKFIRENPDFFDRALARRNIAPHAKQILELDELRRKRLNEIQNLQQQKNEIAKSIGQAKSQKIDTTLLFAQAEEVNNKLEIANRPDESQERLELLLISLPNILSNEVPDGNSENGNKEIRKWGEPAKFDFKPQEHFELGEKLKLMDFEQTAKISGSRFVTLKGKLAKLERVLANFMLDIHTKEFGYTEVSPPLLVKDSAMFGVGQLPKFAEESFSTTNGYRLIPTSEVSLTNLVADMILNEEDLPIRYTAFTPCFRSEAGAAGKDTRGMIRQHQFSKVELVSITTPEQSKEEHERMIGAAEEVLKRLKLPYRVVTLCSGDTGFCSEKTYDIEVWLPGQNKYREISSCSNFGNFVGRRMKSRYRKKGSKDNFFVNTLNGSGLAVGRTIIAIMENYQNKTGTIRVPDVLIEPMGCHEI